MAPRLATQQGKDQSSKSTTTWDAYSSLRNLDAAGFPSDPTETIYQVHATIP
jgi:hypothetical protein